MLYTQSVNKRRVTSKCQFIQHAALIEPFKKPIHDDLRQSRASTCMAVYTCTLIPGQTNQGLFTRHPAKQLLRLALEEMIVGRIKHQRRRVDLLDNMFKSILLRLANYSCLGVDSEYVLAVIQGPFDTRVARCRLANHSIDLVIVLMADENGAHVQRTGLDLVQLGEERAAEIVYAVVEDDGCEAMLECARPGREVPAHAEADEDEFRRVNKGLGDGVVDDGGDDLFPVVSEAEVLLADGRGLPGPVEGEDIHAELESGGSDAVNDLFHGRVVPPVHDDEGPELMAGIGPHHDARKRCSLVGDGNPGGDMGHQRGRFVKRIAGGVGHGSGDLVVVRVLATVELGSAVVVGGAEEGVSGADCVSPGQAGVGVGHGAVGGCFPLLQPEVLVAGGDVVADGDDLANVCGTAGGVSCCADGFVAEALVRGEEVG